MKRWKLLSKIWETKHVVTGFSVKCSNKWGGWEMWGVYSYFWNNNCQIIKWPVMLAINSSNIEILKYYKYSQSPFTGRRGLLNRSLLYTVTICLVVLASQWRALWVFNSPCTWLSNITPLERRGINAPYPSASVLSAGYFQSTYECRQQIWSTTFTSSYNTAWKMCLHEPAHFRSRHCNA